MCDILDDPGRSEAAPRWWPEKYTDEVRSLRQLESNSWCVMMLDESLWIWTLGILMHVYDHLWSMMFLVIPVSDLGRSSHRTFVSSTFRSFRLAFNRAQTSSEHECLQMIWRQKSSRISTSTLQGMTPLVGRGAWLVTAAASRRWCTLLYTYADALHQGMNSVPHSPQKVDMWNSVNSATPT